MIDPTKTKIKSSDSLDLIGEAIEDFVNIHQGDDPVLSALHNLKQFNVLKHLTWLGTKSQQIKGIVERRPPNRLYEYRGEFVYIVGYGESGRICVHAAIKGPTVQSVVSPYELKDITDSVKAKYGFV